MARQHTQFFAWALGLTALALSGGALAGQNDSGRFATHLGKDRLLIIRGGDGLLQPQLAALDVEGVAARDLVIIELSADEALFLTAGRDGFGGGVEAGDYRPEIRRFGLDRDGVFVVLVGKDTGVKARWSGVVTADDLYDRIDAMPMRRFEMESRQGVDSQ